MFILKCFHLYVNLLVMLIRVFGKNSQESPVFFFFHQVIQISLLSNTAIILLKHYIGSKQWYCLHRYRAPLFLLHRKYNFSTS